MLGAVIDATAGQLGSLVSPGRLARAHAALEGAGMCAQCHEPGRQVTPRRCLTCHAPIAERIARKAGVHRAAGNDCVTCHSEHGGVDADLRHLDARTFNHAVDTAFPLTGRHAPLQEKCAACHTRRSFLGVSTSCSSCHADVHKGALGLDCVRCHSASAPFTAARGSFDHRTARFALTGAHLQVTCAKCHAGGAFRGVRFETCTSCHQEPHGRKFGATCTSCHTTEHWTTRTVDHAKTDFPLRGAHAQAAVAAACAKCHTSATTTRPVRFEQCVSCHVNVHRESIRQDCRECHSETTFANATFDHGTRTAFVLQGAHVAVACAKCHLSAAPTTLPPARRVLDYSGARRACVSCHADTHKGAYGVECSSCHTQTHFDVKGFVHPTSPEFFGGQHRTVTCAQCHVQALLAPTISASTVITAGQTRFPTTVCSTCHADVHLGQLGAACESCHTVDAPKFAAAGFAHARTAFPLTGRHEPVACAACHPTVSAAFPSGTGTAVRVRPVSTECRTCHSDPHLGQVDTRCEQCHSSDTFKVTTFTHRGYERLFSDFHGRLACAACHKKETGPFPAGYGTAVRLKVGTTCVACHPR